MPKTDQDRVIALAGAMQAADLVRSRPRSIGEDALAVEAATLMEDACITTLLVHDGEGRLVGALNTNDLMRAKVI